MPALEKRAIDYAASFRGRHAPRRRRRHTLKFRQYGRWPGPSSLPHQYLADEITSERDRIDRQLRTRERWMAALMPARFQRIRSTH